MTLFDVEAQPIARAANPVTGAERPKWAKYSAKTRSRCSECEEVAFETLPAPMPLIRQARFMRRQDGKTRYYCHDHGALQRAEDALAFPRRGAAS